MRQALGIFLMIMRLPAILSGTQGSFPAETTPPIPVGLDAYRLWDEWPLQRIGMRAYMRSTYDRTGGNEGADSSHFLYQYADDSNVTLDIEGQGVLMFSRFNHWHGSPWHFFVDGRDYSIKEGSTDDPLHPNLQSTFLPKAPFPGPLNETWATTRGADLMWSPIEFQKSFMMAYARTHYGTGYYIYDQFVPGTPLTHPIQSWTPNVIPDSGVLTLLSRSGTDIAPVEGVVERRGSVDLGQIGVAPVVMFKGRGAVRLLSFSIPNSQAAAFENAHLRIYWDGRSIPSVDAPMALFFGAGTLFNRDNREYLVKSFPANIRFADRRIGLSCYFPMPYFKSARIEILSSGQPVSSIQWSIRTLAFHQPANQLSYFHATYKDHANPTPGQDLVLLDTNNEEKSSDWSGSFIGTSFIFSHAANLVTLEGDPRFFFDDSQTPQAQGTGTEEWGGGGDYWGNGMTMSLPFAGHPVGPLPPCQHSPSNADCGSKNRSNPDSQIESAYRFLLGDLMPFGRRAIIRMEHGGLNESTEHYETVAYWYGLPSPSLVKTDRLAIGNQSEETSHHYNSPDATAPYTIESRYEWGVDHFDHKVIYPPQQATGRTTKGTSQFELRLRADNLGVLLRRKLDYYFPNQRARVFVADSPNARWKYAGIWYLAGSNTVVYSNPSAELAKSEHIVERSNRRFRDDEFLIARDLTRGKKKIWVRIQSAPVNKPLYPRQPPGDQAWSEIEYTAYCFVLPKAPR
jgi:hypothetical protein